MNKKYNEIDPKTHWMKDFYEEGDDELITVQMTKFEAKVLFMRLDDYNSLFVNEHSDLGRLRKGISCDKEKAYLKLDKFTNTIRSEDVCGLCKPGYENKKISHYMTFLPCDEELFNKKNNELKEDMEFFDNKLKNPLIPWLKERERKFMEHHTKYTKEQIDEIMNLRYEHVKESE